MKSMIYIFTVLLFSITSYANIIDIRFVAKPEFQNYFEMFKWFSNSLGDIIEQLVPRNTRFLGVDFVYESHPLERNRFRYLFDEIYLTSNERSFDRGNLLLSQYTGNICKF